MHNRSRNPNPLLRKSRSLSLKALNSLFQDDEGTPRAYSSFFGDEETQFLEYVPDIYTYLLHLEVQLPFPSLNGKCRAMNLQQRQSLSADFLKGEVSGRHRAILVDWIVQVHTRFHLLPETLHLTVLLLDRYLQVLPLPLALEMALVCRPAQAARRNCS